VYSLYKFPSGTNVMTTSLGLFTHHAGDTSWTMHFPQNGYLSSIPIYADNARHLYAIGGNRVNGFNDIPADIFISTDEGTTWEADTTGLSKFSNGSEFIDELGNEHLATNDQPHMRMFVKTSGGTWEGDSN